MNWVISFQFVGFEEMEQYISEAETKENAIEELKEFAKRSVKVFSIQKKESEKERVYGSGHPFN